MKVLYVSDLDGTLLNKEQKLSLSTIEKLNDLIEKGISFINAKPIPNEKVIELMKKLHDFDTKTFEIQTIINNKLSRFSIENWDRNSKVLAINLLFEEQRKEKLSNILNGIEGINFFIHKRVYSDGECFCDIILENVSKASRLKEFKGSENDLPLAEVSDEFYAVENSAEIVKKNATSIIGSCYKDGVVNFISKDISKYV